MAASAFARAALDTNILLYAEGVNGVKREQEVRALLSRLPLTAVLVPALVLGELYNVLSKRAGRTRAAALRAAADWQTLYAPVPLSTNAMAAALALAAEHQLQIWDAAILASAAEADCTMLLSEDMQHGFRWGRVTVVNPMAHPEHPLLAQLLD